MHLQPNAGGVDGGDLTSVQLKAGGAALRHIFPPLEDFAHCKLELARVRAVVEDRRVVVHPVELDEREGRGRLAEGLDQL